MGKLRVLLKDVDLEIEGEPDDIVKLFNKCQILQTKTNPIVR